jgi:transcriptional regulator GlxA family with amidase domain
LLDGRVARLAALQPFDLALSPHSAAIVCLEMQSSTCDAPHIATNCGRRADRCVDVDRRDRPTTRALARSIFGAPARAWSLAMAADTLGMKAPVLSRLLFAEGQSFRAMLPRIRLCRLLLELPHAALPGIQDGAGLYGFASLSTLEDAFYDQFRVPLHVARHMVVSE